MFVTAWPPASRPGAPVRPVLERAAKPPACNYKKGPEVEAIVLAVDVDRERISLGIKQLDQDLLTTFVTVNDKGSVEVGKAG